MTINIWSTKLFGRPKVMCSNLIKKFSGHYFSKCVVEHKIGRPKEERFQGFEILKVRNKQCQEPISKNINDS